MTTPKRTLLNIYRPNQIRLDSLQFPLTMTLTKWINEAISEKLDKALPETAGVSPMVEKPAVPFDPMVERRRLMRLQQGPNYIGPYILKYKGTTAYLHAEHKHKKMGSGSRGIEAILEDLYIAAGQEMTTQEKGAVLAAHAMEEKRLAECAEKARKEQEQEVEALKEAATMEDTQETISPHAASYAKFEAVQKANRERMLAADELLGETPLVNVAAPAMEDPADFWGEDDAAYHKIKAKACKA